MSEFRILWMFYWCYSERLPVFMWIHGGGYQLGGGVVYTGTLLGFFTCTPCWASELTTCLFASLAKLLNSEHAVICILCWASELWTTLHKDASFFLASPAELLNSEQIVQLHPLLSYWTLNNLSLLSSDELLKSEQPVTCIPCWAIAIWTTCHFKGEGH